MPFASQYIRFLRSYLIFAGAILNAIFLVAVIGVFITLDQPLGHAIDSTVNNLVYNRVGPAQKVGKLALRYRLAEDWNDKAGLVNDKLSSNPLQSAANPDLQFPYQTYDGNVPRGLTSDPFFPPTTTRVVTVSTSTELLSAIGRAQGGDIINLVPGRYALRGQSIPITNPGTPDKPIYVRSSRLGEAILEMDTLEGFHVLSPFWVFENLVLQGVCKNDNRCEHAFHVVGRGASFTLRNSKLLDFNASIKVNGYRSSKRENYPDNGLLEYNLFANSRARKTESPVTLLNINSVSNWVVRGNFIADFSKNGSDHISYGAFMKGGGQEGIFERNLVMCENRLAADRGIRIGLSFGGGGTGAQFCRHGDCSSEHSNGIMRNNIVLNCSRDVGMYINKGSNSQIYNNLLHNTLGIDLRFPISSATIENNIISGRIKARDGGVLHAGNNIIDRHCLGQNRSNCSFDEMYAAPDRADLRLKTIAEPIWEKGKWTDLVSDDFCGNSRIRPTDVGPLQYSQGLDCLQP